VIIKRKNGMGMKGKGKEESYLEAQY